jgi:hypothetical protein
MELFMRTFKIISILTALFCIILLIPPHKSKDGPSSLINSNPIAMPIVKETNPLLAGIKHGIPSPNRNKDVRKWLQSSFKIDVGNGSGSGTLCYYDRKTNTAYVISCGHLWGDGVLRKTRENNLRATIITWYHNSKKLNQPKSYKGKIIFCFKQEDGVDVSLLTFKPDWIPEIYYPIAKLNQLEKGKRLHSVGCDHGSEVADYFVEVIGMEGRSLVTQYNSPRPGRSGGGLIDQEGYFVGICWGTSNTKGTGTGYFVPLSVIHKVYKEQGYVFLLNQSLPGLARSLPIVNHGPNKQYDREYILIPKR